MSKGIFVVIPDDLFEKLETMKGKIDVSDVCTRALERELEKIETMVKPEKREARSRIDIKISSEDYIKLWKARGAEDGFKDAENFSYRAFMEILQIYKNLNALVDRFGLDEMIPGELYDSILHPRLKDLEEGSPERTNYLAGWIEGIIQRWNKVKDRF